MNPQQNALYRIFSPPLRSMLEKAELDYESLQEIRLRTGRPLLVRCGGKEWAITASGKRSLQTGQAWIVTKQAFQETLQILSAYSLYAFEEEVKQGFLTINGGHRVGIGGQVILENGAVKSIKNISCLNIRLAHQVKGCADGLLPYVTADGRPLNSLLISPPRCGKTTLLRDLIRQFSNGTALIPGQTVGVVDERSEIGGCYMGIPQNDLGIRTDILDCCPKAEGMMMLIRSMAPDLVAVDEIGDERDSGAIASVIRCGCRLLATVHGSSLEDIRKKPLLEMLMQKKVFDRYVLLSGDKKTGRIEAVYDREGACVYGQERGRKAGC